MRWCLCFLLLAEIGGFAEGVRAYEAGRFEEARAAFVAAAEEAGDDASAELLHDLALSALRAHDLQTAEIAAEKAAVRGGAPFVGLRDFLLGNVAYARCEKAEVLADLPEAGPVAVDGAILHADAARRFWEDAAMSRDDWPQARRNVARALAKLDVLRKKREEAEKKKRSARREPKKPSEPPPPRNPQEQPPEAPFAPQLSELSAEQVRSLLEKLERKEDEKRRLRRARLEAQRGIVERDW